MTSSPPGQKTFPGVARATAEVLAARAETEYVDPLWIAGDFARAGQTDEAMRWLEKAFENRSPLLVLIRVNPDLDPLRSDPRFQELARRIPFPDYGKAGWPLGLGMEPSTPRRWAILPRPKR